jgi:ferrous iron transport protein A
VTRVDRSARSSIPLTHLRRGETAIVAGLAVDPALGGSESEAALLTARLRDLGFVSGARCEVIARMWLGGDPLVVRIGGSTFALRRLEAAAVLVQPELEQPVGHAALLQTSALV